MSRITETTPDAHRRDIPDGSRAMAVLGFSWAEIVALLAERIRQAAPEVAQRETIWSIHARPNGIRIEFYDDERKYFEKLERHAASQALSSGPQVHAGRLTDI